MADSTSSGARRKKPKFPLWLHASGQWTKKIGKKFYYFGTDRDAALADYLRRKDNPAAGRRSEAEGERVTLKHVCNVFLTHKTSQVKLGELRQSTFNDYHGSCEGLVEFFGGEFSVAEIRPDDLLRYRQKLAETSGPTTLGNEVNRCRVVLRFAFENGLIDKPVRFGEFKRPAKSAMRRQRAKVGPRLFEPDILRQLLAVADEQMTAMILLGINAGLGNADCGMLPISAINLTTGWIDYPRAKTGVARRCPLWAETIEAIKAVIRKRKPPEDEAHAGLLFLTKRGRPWFVDGAPGSPLSAEFRKLLVKIGAYRPGLSFYTIRHSFQTIGDETGDYLGVMRIMGHSDASISDHYRERFQDSRLLAVTEHVRGWLFGTTEGGAS